MDKVFTSELPVLRKAHQAQFAFFPGELQAYDAGEDVIALVSSIPKSSKANLAPMMHSSPFVLALVTHSSRRTNCNVRQTLEI